MSLRIQWISAARGEKKGRFPFVTLKINWIGTDQPRWSFNTKNRVSVNFISFKTLWPGQKVDGILNVINHITQTPFLVLMVWTKSVLSEKYLLRNISVDGGVVWDNSDKVWCNILEIKRMRSQGSHHHPALNKERRRQYGLCSQGDYSIDPRIYLPIEVCSTISFSVVWRPDIFSLLAKTVRFSSPSQQGAFVKSRFSILCMEYLRTTNLPSIMQPCGKLLRHLKVTFFNAFWIRIWFCRPEGGRVLQLFAWLNLIWFGTPQQTWNGPSLKV